MAGPMRPGELVWIGLRPIRNGSILAPTSAMLVSRRGIEGDHRARGIEALRRATVQSQRAQVLTGHQEQDPQVQRG
jgi:hypothetical protein